MLFLSEPEGFSPKFHVVGCFLEHNGKFLMLHRQDHKREGNLWGVPAGKIDPGETKEEAIVREVFEESGVRLEVPPGFVATTYVRFTEMDIVYHIFRHVLSEEPDVVLSPTEHKAFRWVTPEECLRLPCVEDEEPCVRLAYPTRV